MDTIQNTSFDNDGKLQGNIECDTAKYAEIEKKIL